MRASQGQMIFLKNYKKPEYKVLSVDLDISLHATETRVVSKLTLQREKGVANDTGIFLDGDELELVSVNVAGKALLKDQYKLTDSSLLIKDVPKKQKFDVEIITQVNPTANTKLMGLYRSGGNYCTQCEAEGFRRITFFPDRPDVLAVYTTRLEADKKEAPILLGNGNLVKKGSAGKGRHYAIWHDPHPKPSYLFALVGGDLGSIHKPFKTASGRRVKLGIYVQKGKEGSADYAMDALIRSMRWDEEVFGREYDLDVFNIVAIPDFNMGAMENKGLNVFNDKYVLADPQSATDTDYDNIERIIAHEYFHNWTGNRITCRDWFQLCLKEGLTVYRDQEFSSDMRSRSVKRIQDVRTLKAHQFPEDAGPLAHPVRPQSYSEINNFYTTTIYEKGAELVRMIATLLGKKNFQKGLDLYFRRHDGDAATIEDFLACFEKAAKVNLTHFALWYSQAGTPRLAVTSNYDKTKRQLTLEIEQMTLPTPGQRRKKPMHIPQQIGLVGKDGDILSAKVSGVPEENGVFQISKQKQKLVFNGIEERPVLSLNRGFTAPVEIDYRQSTSDLAFLAVHDSDAYGQWQSFQTLAMRTIIQAMKAIIAGKTVDIDNNLLDVAEQITTDNSLEPAFRACILNLPSEGDIAQAVGRNVNPQAIHEAHEKVSAAIGKRLLPVRKHLLKVLATPGEFKPDAEDAGKRSLKNSLLTLALIAKCKTAAKDVEAQFSKANNMTDQFAALSAIVKHHPSKSVRNATLDKFYAKYKDNHLVLDKWFSIQAMRADSQTIAIVKKLMRHETFSFKNPNRLRSLIGVFAAANPSTFNHESGNGYRLVADVVSKMDKINPQVAARLLTTFRSYRSLDADRRKLAEQALKSIRDNNQLSRDVEDILNRTLG